jgi:hypothetical protein
LHVGFLLGGFVRPRRATQLGLVAVGVLLWAASVVLLSVPSATAKTSSRRAEPAADFNGDGWGDLAVRSEENVMEDFEFRQGVVHIVYGGSGGLAARASQRWYSTDFDPSNEANEYFGIALAVGDFDEDGFSDLALVYSGAAVRIIYGSSNGLTKARSQVWTPDSLGIELDGPAYFGFTLAAGNFGHGSEEDLALSVSYSCGAGAVVVIYGSSAGLASAGNQTWSQDSPGVLGKAEGDCDGGDRFGASLAAGHFFGGSYADLAIGSPNESLKRVRGAGAVNILRGAASGLTAEGDQMWTQDSRGIKGKSEANDRFGEVLVAGDFNGDTRDDLAVGVVGQKVHRAAFAGAVNVIYGSAYGLTAKGDQLWFQNSPGIAGGGVNRGIGSVVRLLRAISVATRRRRGSPT